MTIMKTRSIRFVVEDLNKAGQLAIDVNEVSRKAIRTAIHKEALKLPTKMISFKKSCSCGHVCDHKNSQRISMTELGVRFGCPACDSTGLTGSYKINYKK